MYTLGMGLSQDDRDEVRRIAADAIDEARTADGAALFLVDEETRRRIVAVEAGQHAPESGQQALSTIASAIVDRLERMDVTFARLMDMQSEQISALDVKLDLLLGR